MFRHVVAEILEQSNLLDKSFRKRPESVITLNHIFVDVLNLFVVIIQQQTSAVVEQYTIAVVAKLVAFKVIKSIHSYTLHHFFSALQGLDVMI